MPITVCEAHSTAHIMERAWGSGAWLLQIKIHMAYVTSHMHAQKTVPPGFHHGRVVSGQRTGMPGLGLTSSWLLLPLVGRGGNT